MWQVLSLPHFSEEETGSLRGRDSSEGCLCQVELGLEPESGEHHGPCSHPPPGTVALLFVSKLRPREDTCHAGTLERKSVHPVEWEAHENSTLPWAPGRLLVHGCVETDTASERWTEMHSIREGEDRHSDGSASDYK